MPYALAFSWGTGNVTCGHRANIRELMKDGGHFAEASNLVESMVLLGDAGSGSQGDFS